MATVAGIDGCSAGWICILKDLSSGQISSRILFLISDLLKDSLPSVVTIDIPIGLPDKGSRGCDLKARKLLKKRASSVFPSPIRPALAATTYAEACRITSLADGRSISQQAWQIIPKIKQVDELLLERRELRKVIKEIHPELCFLAMNDGEALDYSKKSVNGKRDRTKLVETIFGARAFDNMRAKYTSSAVTDDDINDAFAALWTAERMLKGEARVIEQNPSGDSTGLPMEMWY